jgi:two-component system, cell cycle sensor histidine kinase and response regulator CckA
MAADGLNSAELTSRLAAIVESSDDAIIGKTLDGIITNWNGGAERIYGYSAGEMIGQSVLRLFPDDLAEELGPVMGQLRRGERVEHYATRRVRKDGQVIDVSVSISPIRDLTGTVVGAATVARDMTAQRALEARLRQSERTETVGKVAKGIAHDFNNLLGAIVGYAELVAEATTDRGIQADAGQIETAAHRAARLTRQLLVFSQRERTQPVVLDVNAVITDLRDLLRLRVNGRVELRYELAAGVPAIVADRFELEQVLLNLAANALDAMPSGGTVTVATGAAELSGADAGPGPGVNPGWYAELRVSDTGAGMSEEVARRIFEPFFTTKPVGRGVGLGLSTVQNIVAKSGGMVSVESEAGAGTTVRAYLPATERPVRRAAPAPVTPAARGDGEIILVVDDEPALLSVTARILRRNGYVALEAGRQDDALAVLASTDVDLVLTDSLMPGISADEMAVRVIEVRPRARVLRMSGFNEAVLGPQPEHAAERGFIQKPFTAETLLTRVRMALDSTALDSTGLSRPAVIPEGQPDRVGGPGSYPGMTLPGGTTERPWRP